MVLEIKQIPDPILRTKSKKVSKIRQRGDLRVIADNLIETMNAYDGVGLSAIQVGIPLRLFVMATKPVTIFVNPEILGSSGEVDSTEGCLSIPGYFETIKRAEKIRFRGYNLLGHKLEMNVEGDAARVIQHEIDHLNGILYVDHIEVTADEVSTK